MPTDRAPKLKGFGVNGVRTRLCSVILSAVLGLSVMVFPVEAERNSKPEDTAPESAAEATEVLSSVISAEDDADILGDLSVTRSADSAPALKNDLKGNGSEAHAKDISAFISGLKDMLTAMLSSLSEVGYASVVKDSAVDSVDPASSEDLRETETALEVTPPTTAAANAEQNTTKPAEEETTSSVRIEKPYVLAQTVEAMSEKAVPDDLYLDENGIPVGYTKKFTGKATAYSGYGLTSTGRTTMQGSVAVNPKIIPYGTKMWIVSDDGRYVYGYSVAEDTGGFIYWKNAPIADLFMYSEDECNEFGRRNVTIYILP
ncbi:MAG: 3D domain-containing protein [Clostridiales bacterium]|nr:3D domain-containing protein [Clostridiales bacterium]